MKKRTPNKLLQRIGAFVLTMVMVIGILPANTIAAGNAGTWSAGEVITAADPGTTDRLESVYGDNTLNAGKITVDKSVSKDTVALENNTSFTPTAGNLMVTVSQTAQILGLASEQAVPVDVVFVLDTSASMEEDEDDDGNNRAEEMVTAANDAIKTLMASNPNNRIGVVAFSSSSNSASSAQVLSSLAHYTDGRANDNSDNAASEHLRWVTSNGGTTGNDRDYIAGRNSTGNRRHGFYGGTNIHAGIALGAKQLMDVTDTTVTLEDGTSVTRMPFLIILSDGQPTYIANDANGSTWYEPVYSNNLGAGNDPYEGAGFVAALTAAYYKGKISEHYYGSQVDEDNRCTVYTVGVELESLEGNDAALAQITMDPATYTTGDYAANNAASYWNYGNSHTNNANSRNTTHGWKTYWEKYTAATAASFDVRVDSGSGKIWIGEGAEGTGAPTVPSQPRQPNLWEFYEGSGWNQTFNQAAYDAAMAEYRQKLAEYNTAKAAYDAWEKANYRTVDYTPYLITKESIAATKNYVIGNIGAGYAGGIAYNDDYFATGGDQSVSDAFDQIVTSISKKALSSPTHVDQTHGEDFSGYVTFYDPIGEYMEVKDVHGIVADGNLYQGKTAAQYLSDWTNAPKEFKDAFANVLRERCKVTGATMDNAQIDAFVAKAAASKNQANYDPQTDAFDNSIVWWGKIDDASGNEDPQVQYLAFADDDSVEYIEEQKNENLIPADADYVCRSYYYYGTAGNTAINPNNEYLHFVIRVQRALTAPYQQTVVISAPASLLSVEKVFVTEKTDNQGNTTYEAEVTETDPARVVYEVGLRSDINAYNVDQIVGEDAAYVGQTTVDHEGGAERATNYDAATGTYTFYTNDWDRTQTEDSFHRAQAKATFEAAVDNSFYTYTEDTLVYTLDGSRYVPYNGNTQPVGSGYYYARTYYDWSGKTPADNVYAAEKKTEYIPIVLPNTSRVAKAADGYWYIAKGTYKASSLDAGERVEKSENNTNTSSVVSHPHRTTSETDNHYTVLLGNNGLLTLQAEKTKSVYKGEDTTVNIDGQVVMVGDVLTYKIKVENPDSEPTTATVTDSIPKGTEYVEDSASYNGVWDERENKLTWTDVPVEANGSVELSFQVKVTTDLMGVVSIDNTAHVKLDNDFEYETNTTKNPPEGKRIVDSEGKEIEDGSEVAVQDVLVYRIMWQNDTGEDGTVTITDIIPDGTSYVANSADHGGVYDKDTNTLKWTIEAKAGASGVVSFRVNVNASAGETITNNATVTTGPEDAPNIRVTNTPTVKVKKDELIITKAVNAPAGSGAFGQVFTLNITEIGQGMNDTYKLFRNGVEDSNGIKFDKGSATVTIKHGETIVIQDIPVGAILSVTEKAKDGFTPTYKVGDETSDAEGRVTIVEDPAEQGEQTETSAKVEITNDYSPVGVEVKLSGKKQLNTTGTVDDVTFGFTAAACNASGELLTGDKAELLTGEVTVSSKNKNANIVFAPLSFTKTGTYHYLIDEIDGSIKGISYDKTEYLVTIKVTDDGSGKLQAAASLQSKAENANDFTAVEGTEFTFINTYAPLDTSLTLKGNKTLTGRNLEAGRYSFEVKDQNGNVVTTGTNLAPASGHSTGAIEFKPITYKAEDLGQATTTTFTYTVSEVKGNLTGVTYDPTSYTVQVELKNDGGQLVANVVKVGDQAVSNNNYSLNFTNKFDPEDVTLELTGTKTLNDGKPADKQFSFLVKENGEVVSTGTNDGNGNIQFSPIVYQVEGTHTYTVTELIPDALGKDPNMDYDETEYTVTVQVSYDSTTGELSVGNPVIKKGDSTVETIAFANTKYPAYISVAPAGFKHTTLADGVEGVVPSGSYSFTVLDGEGKEVSVGVGTANPTDTATPNIQFSSLTFGNADVGKTYTYTIKESYGNNDHGITHDPAEFTMEITISRETSGELKANVVYRKGTDIVQYPTFNNTYAAQGTLQLSATKKLNGSNAFDGKTFAFKLQQVDAQGNAIGEALDGVSDTSGNVNFATLYYDTSDVGFEEEATVYYKVTEVDPGAAGYPGVTYDTGSFTVTVNLSHETQGQIVAAIDSIVDENNQAVTSMAFENTYAPVTGTSVTIKANKKLTGRDLKEGEFSFELYHVNGTSRTLVDAATNAKDTDNDGIAEIVFTRDYPATTTPGTYTYEIVELNNNLGGIHYAENTLSVNVTITDSGDGTLSAVASAENAGTFENVYMPAEIMFRPTIKKELEHRELGDLKFSFVIKDGDKTVSTGINNADGTISFTPISYTAAGTYNYTVSEVKGNLSGIKYDETVKYMVVTVTDDGNGNLSASEKYYTDDRHSTETSNVFTNTYTPDNVTVTLEATKVLTGRDMEKGEFSFVAKEVIDGTAGAVKATGGNAAAKADANAKVTFSNIGYSLADLSSENSKEFIYELSEQKSSQGGVTSSDAKFYAKVTLKYDDTTGELKVEEPAYFSDITCDTPATPKFENKYEPTKATLQLPVDKVLINKAFKQPETTGEYTGEFTFDLVPLKADGTKDQTLYSVTNDAFGVVKFPQLEFVKPGIYMYTVEERVTNTADADRYTLDDPFTVKVTVTDNLNGQLIANAEYFVNYKGDNTDVNLGAIDFINRYTAPPIEVDLTEAIDATKTLSGREEPIKANEFTFKVYDIQNNEVSKGSNAAPDATGKAQITFEKFKFNQAGQYRYWIVEDDPTSGGVSKDARVWEVRILVRYNENNENLEVDGQKVPVGQLYVAKADVQSYLLNRSEENETSKPAFENVYTPAPVKAQIEVQKLLEGRDPRNQEFLFQLKEGELVVGEARNDADGYVVFEMNYSKAGTYIYEISEVKGDDTSITYDGESREVTVTVTDDSKGQLHAAVSTDTAPVQFKNTYTPAPAEVVVEASKIVTGDKSFTGEEFTFVLENKPDAQNPAVDATAVRTVKNDADGLIKFAFELDKVGSYRYVMSEAEVTDQRYKRDETTHVVIVEVTDDTYGQLHAEVTYETTSAPEFENVFTAGPTSIILEGTKILTGRELEEGEFTFKITDGNDMDLEVTHDEEGNLLIDEITLPVAGTYRFTITEVKGTEQYMTYDETAFEVVVQVTNENGELIAVAEYPEGGVVFQNTYKVPETTQPTQPTQPTEPGSPDTGDRSNVLGYSVLAVVSLGLAMALVLMSKRRKARG